MSRGLLVQERDVRAMLRLAVELAHLPPDAQVRARWVHGATFEITGGDASREVLAHLFTAETERLMRASAPQLIVRADAACDSLPPRLRKVLRCLLTGRSEKEVARDLHLSTHTVNSYVKALYRHFGTSSRGELMARFVQA